MQKTLTCIKEGRERKKKERKKRKRERERESEREKKKEKKKKERGHGKEFSVSALDHTSSRLHDHWSSQGPTGLQ